MQPLKVGHVLVYILGLRMMLSRFWYKGDHSWDPKCYVVRTFRRGNAPFWIQIVISLVTESKQQQNTGLCFCLLRLIRSVVEGSRGIFESTS